MRAIRARYDPYLQTRHRVEQVLYFIYSFDISVNFGRMLIIKIYELATVNIAILKARKSCMLFF